MATGTMTPEESLALIKANLSEVLNPEIIDDVVLKEKRPLRVYWGTAPTGRPHCGYFVPMIKIAELLHAGCHVQILLADLHAYLDNMKSTLELVEYRAKYYEAMIKSLLKAVGVDISQLHFVLGSTYQRTGDYFLDTLKLCAPTTISNAQRAGAEVVKQTDNPCLGGLIYPLMQALDEEYLKVDAQFGGVDQRKIFTCALENLPRVGYRVRAHLMNPMVPGLGTGEKMSASDPNSKIDLLDSPDVIDKKLKKAICVPQQVEGNGVLAFLEHVIFRALNLKNKGDVKFVVKRRDAEPLEYTDIETLKKDYANDVLTPQLLKPALTRELDQLLAPVQAEFKESAEWQEIEKKAYPPAEPEQKKVKQKKDKGDPAKREAARLARQAQLAVDTVKEGVDKIEVKN
ncbi:putative tyrosyl-tRNA synthetase [Zalerion maritima]|uniref:Tyrosine--tRNA ligase n=1 Tax=Zalerion maritima TaxID=339359 RepID=A0AAD5RJS1_9PEZI|nr:putative tyrosyl-tRNA synthetase [Zalerion maritima]